MRVKILPAGTKVTIHGGGDYISGTVLSANIRAGNVVMHDVIYWNNGEQELVSLHDWEFDAECGDDWVTLESVE